MLYGMRITGLLILQLTWMTATAVAQAPARSFDELTALVKPGDVTTVTDVAGHTTTGRIADLSTTSLSLIVDAQRREIRESEVATILGRQRDSLADGALWGAAIGGGVGLAFAGAAGDRLYWSTGAFMAISAGIGAGVGLGIDSAIKKTRVIYQRPPSKTTSVWPVVGRRGNGLFATVRF